MAKIVWEYVIEVNCRVQLYPESGDRLHLTVDWCSTGQGYVLWSGQPTQSRVLAIGSRRAADPASSVLGELRTLCWALQETMPLSAGRGMIAWTDSESAYMRISSPPSSRAFGDVRVVRLLEWLVSNFGGRLDVRYLPGSNNDFVDTLSRWYDGDDGAAVMTVLTGQKKIWFDRAHQGHWGVDKTLQHLRRDGRSWLGDAIDVKRMIELCSVCQKFGPRQFRHPWHGIPTSRVNEVVHLDFFGPIRWHGRMMYFLVIVDAFSCFCRVTVSRRPSSKNVLRGLRRWETELAAEHSPIGAILTDNAQAFIGSDVTQWCQNRGIVRLRAGILTPQSNGLVERQVGLIKSRMRRMWLAGGYYPSVTEIEAVVNSSVNRVTGYTPDEIVFGKRRTGDFATSEELAEWRENARHRSNEARNETTRRHRKKENTKT